jgi:undecaprenyl-diphosphatase
MLQKILKLLQWLRAREIKLLLGVLLVVAGTWVFIELADAVSEGDTQKFDVWAVRALRQADNPAIPIGPAWVQELARDLTALGGITVLSLLLLSVIGFLFLQRKYGAMWLVMIASASGFLVSTAAKELFHRARPDVVPHLSYVKTASFPSGHSMLSAVVYLTLGSILTRLVKDRRTKAYLLVVPLLLTFLVGVSRVYLGVHYPTDVLAGWTAGIVWAVFCWLVARSLQKRGAVEGSD